MTYARLVTGFCAFLLLVLLGGCHPTPRPTAEVQAVRVADTSPEATRLEVDVQLHNPSPQALPLRVAMYRIDIEGVGRVEMWDQPPLALPPGGRQRFVLPASVRTDGQELAGREASVRAAVEYQPEGHIRHLLTRYNLPLPSARVRSVRTIEAGEGE